MRDLVVSENAIRLADLPSEWAAELRALRGRISARGQLLWRERCSQQLAPGCYARCPEYTPRPDLHCRRFDRGIEAVRVEGVPGTLMRVRFRKWGRLEAEGPSPLVSARTAASWERVHESLGRAVDLVPISREGRGALTGVWTQARARAGRARDGARPQAFVLECVSETERAVPLTITIAPSSPDRRGSFEERIEIGLGYNRAVIPIARIAARIDVASPYSVQIEPVEESPPVVLLFGIVDLFASDGTISAVGRPAPVRETLRNGRVDRARDASRERASEEITDADELAR